MALPPTIPTSFVPKQPVATTPKRRSGSNPFLALSYFILAIVVLGCFAVFGYKLYLEGVAKHKADQVIQAQNSIDQATVTQFIRLRDRFTAAKDVLNHQVALSRFFDVLETLTLQGVRFSGLKVSVVEDRTASVTMNGSAKSFNTLAAQSQAFASDKRIKRAIFSGINVGSGTTKGVTFELTAELDPLLVVISTGSTALVAPPVAAPIQATTTPAL